MALLKTRVAAAYRLVISFQTEEQRATWVGTADHQRVWPQMEANLKGAKFSATLWQTTCETLRKTVCLLIISNLFMTVAWYGHLKDKSRPLAIAILLSWG